MRFPSKEGVLQVATGFQHQDEAIASAEQIRPYLLKHPGVLT